METTENVKLLLEETVSLYNQVITMPCLAKQFKAKILEDERERERERWYDDSADDAWWRFYIGGFDVGMKWVIA